MGWMKGPSGAHKVDCAIFPFFSRRKLEPDSSVTRALPHSLSCILSGSACFEGASSLVVVRVNMPTCPSVSPSATPSTSSSIAQKKRTECCCINLNSSYVQNYCIAHFRI